MLVTKHKAILSGTLNFTNIHFLNERKRSANTTVVSKGFLGALNGL